MKNIEEIQQLIDAEIKTQNRILEPKELYEPIWYALSNGGKRLRPVLLILGTQMFTDDIEEAVLPALGIEMFHNFTLLHDDIMDKAFLRRNRPTVHIKWDVNRAILSGDALAIQSNIFIASCRKDVLPDVLSVFNKTALQVCEGQQYDMNFEIRESVSEKEYMKMIRLKTAVLIAGCLKIGSIIGGAEKSVAQKAYDFGFALGMAFQLQDDLLDSFGKTQQFGKKIGGDIRANKKTYLTIKAYETGSKDDIETLNYWYNHDNPDQDKKLKEVLAVFKRIGVDDMTREKVHQYSEEALQLLEDMPVPEKRKKELENFTRQLMDRVN